MQSKYTQKKKELPRRKRLLNIIFFIDANRTRTIRMPMKWVHAVSALFLLLLVWTGLSTYMAFMTYQEKNRTREMLTDALETVFDFQSRYQDIFQKAYPKQPPLSAPEEESGHSENNLTAQEGNQPPPAKSSPDSPDSLDGMVVEGEDSPETGENPSHQGDLTNLPQNTSDAPPVPQPEEGTLIGESPSDMLVTIDQTEFNHSGSNLELSFQIRNTSESQRAEGFVWGIATFVKNDGTQNFFPAPLSVQADQKGEPVLPKNANRYNIRNFKPIRLSFPYPEDGHISQIRVGVMNTSGKTTFFTLPTSQGTQANQGTDKKNG